MIHIRWKAVNAYQANQQTSLNPIASPEPGSRMGLKRNRVERRYKFMKCKRLCAWLLSLVMIISLLPTMALAAEIPAEYKPTIEWTDIGGVIHKYTLTVNVYYEGKYVGKVSSSDNNLSAKVTVPSTMEVQKYEVTGHGCAYSNVSKLFTFTSHVFGGSTEGTLNLYLRSTAGHKVTVEYVYTDDESKNDSKFENVKYARKSPSAALTKRTMAMRSPFLPVTRSMRSIR